MCHNIRKQRRKNTKLLHPHFLPSLQFNHNTIPATGYEIEVPNIFIEPSFFVSELAERMDECKGLVMMKNTPGRNTSDQGRVAIS